MGARKSANTLLQSKIKQIQEPPNGGWGWMVVLGGCIILMNWAGIQRCYSVFYLPLVDEYQSDLGQVAWINGLYSIALAISGLITPPIANKFGYRKIVMTCGIVACLSMFIASFSSKLWQLQILAGFVVGMSFGPATLSVFTVVVRYFSTRRNMAVQIICSGSAFGAFILCPIYQILINMYGWQGAFQVISGFFLQVAVVGAVLFPIHLKEDFVEDNSEIDDNQRRNILNAEHSDEITTSFVQLDPEVNKEQSNLGRNVFKRFCYQFNMQLFISYPFYLYTFGWLTFAISYFSSLTYLVPYGREVLDLSDIQASTLVSAVMGGEALSRLFYALIFDKLVIQTRILLAATVILTMGILFFCFPFLKTYLSILIGCVLIGLFGGGLDGVYSVFMVDVFGLHLYSSAYAYCNLLTHFISMASTILIGKLIDSTANFDLAFYIGGAFAMLSSLFAVLMRRYLAQMKKQQS